IPVKMKVSKSLDYIIGIAVFVIVIILLIIFSFILLFLVSAGISTSLESLLSSFKGNSWVFIILITLNIWMLLIFRENNS
ncbi:MAG: hypothetical protein ACYTXI_37690, partial [Nostoc sp.]